MDGIDSYMTTDMARSEGSAGEISSTNELDVPALPLNDMAIPPLDPVETAQLTHEAEVLDRVVTLRSPEHTSGWTATRKDGIETFVSHDGLQYVRANAGEEADVIIAFTRIPGLLPLRLVRADQSTKVKRAARKKRREERELRKRGYDV